MNLDQQLQALIDHAPQDGETPQMMEFAAPVLKTLAQRLRHLEYYVVQTLDESWVMLTLADPNHRDRQKNVIYAFSSLKDVSASPFNMSDPNLIAMPVPVTHILFQMLAIAESNSTIFFETPGDVSIGTEVQRLELEQLVQASWQRKIDAEVRSNIPDNIA